VSIYFRSNELARDKTCVLPVQLKPAWDYQLRLNSQSFRNFQSDESVPLEPVSYSFKPSDKP
jgi:hypothetical protein